MPDDAAIQQLMALAQGAGGPGGPGAGPGGPPPGAGPGGPPGMPPGGAPPGAAGPGGPKPGGGMGGPPPDPKEMITQGLMALQLGMSQMGGDETMAKVVQLVQKFAERIMKNSPQGRQGAVMGGAQQPPTPPGVGPMPGGSQV